MSPEIGGAVTGILIGAVTGGAGHILLAGRAGVRRWHIPLIGLAGGFMGTVLAAVIGVPVSEPIHHVRLTLQTAGAVVAVAAAILMRRRHAHGR